MEVLWVVPVLVLAFGAVAIVALLRSTADEGRSLRAEIIRFGELHVALTRVNQELARSRSLGEGLRSR